MKPMELIEQGRFLGEQRGDLRLPDQVRKLREKRFLHALERLERIRVAGREAETRPALSVKSVVQREFERRSEVDVRSGRPFADFSVVGDDAAAVVPVARVLGRESGREEHGLPRAVVMDGGKAGPDADEAADVAQERLGRPVMDANAEPRLRQADVCRSRQTHIRQVVDSVRAVAFPSADREILE